MGRHITCSVCSLHNVTVKGLHASEKLSNRCLPADTSGSLRHLSDHDLLRAAFANACVVVHYSFKQRNCTPQFESLRSLLSVTKDGVKKCFALTMLISLAVEANEENAIQIHTCESLALPSNKLSKYKERWGGVCGADNTKENGGVCIDQIIGDLTVLPYFENNPDWIARAILEHCISNQTKTTP